MGSADGVMLYRGLRGLLVRVFACEVMGSEMRTCLLGKARGRVVLVLGCGGIGWRMVGLCRSFLL